MYFGASNHTLGTTSLFNTYDNKKHTQHKVSISDGNHFSVLGYGNVHVPNDTLEYVFHVQGIPINLLSIFHACQKVYKFESWLDKYKLKDIKHCFKIVSSGLVDHKVGLYKFIDFN